MGIAENKTVVRRFTSEVLADGNLDLPDELLAPDFQALDIGGGGIAGFKAAMTSARTVISEFGNDIGELVAEGDAVVGAATASPGRTGARRPPEGFRTIAWLTAES